MSVINLNNSLTETHQVRTNTNCSTRNLTQKKNKRGWSRLNRDLQTAALTSVMLVLRTRQLWELVLILVHGGTCVLIKSIIGPTRSVLCEDWRAGCVLVYRYTEGITFVLPFFTILCCCIMLGHLYRFLCTGTRGQNRQAGATTKTITTTLSSVVQYACQC